MATIKQVFVLVGTVFISSTAVVLHDGPNNNLETQKAALMQRVQTKLSQMDQTDLSKATQMLDTFGKGSSASTTCSDSPLEPVLPGIKGGCTRPKLNFASDVDWPPYAYIGEPPASDFEVAGIGHDIAMGLMSVCDIDVTTSQTSWSDCWSSGAIGAGLKDGHYHACMTYTHTAGQRPRYMEFTHAFLKDNKPAGILTRLDASGNPVVSPMSDLSGVNIVDVNGWAPTSDTLAMVTNPCTGNQFTGYNMLIPTGDGNDAAMEMLMNGTADAMWVYADQAHNYDCNAAGVTPTWDCTLWTGFGTNFAYIQTGLFGHAVNGTTLGISKKGSGIADIVNPCLQAYMQTEEYHNVCVSHGLEGSCYPNQFFANADVATPTWETATNNLATTCADGYCSCSAR